MKLNGKNDFNLWKVKMEALLVHQGLKVALQNDPSGSGLLYDEDFKEKMERHILSLF